MRSFKIFPILVLLRARTYINASTHQVAVMEEEAAAAERAMHSRRESALEAPDADSPTRVEEAEEVHYSEVIISPQTVLLVSQDS